MSDFFLYVGPYRLQQSAIGSVSYLLSLLKIEHSIRDTMTDPDIWRVDIATSQPLYLEEKQVIRDTFEDFRYPGVLIKVWFGCKKGSVRGYGEVV